MKYRITIGAITHIEVSPLSLFDFCLSKGMIADYYKIENVICGHVVQLSNSKHQAIIQYEDDFMVIVNPLLKLISSAPFSWSLEDGIYIISGLIITDSISFRIEIRWNQPLIQYYVCRIYSIGHFVVDDKSMNVLARLNMALKTVFGDYNEDQSRQLH